MRATRAYWLSQLVGWGLYVAFTVVQGLSEGDVSLVAALLGPVISALLGIAITHGARALALRKERLEASPGRLLVRVLASSAVCSVVHVASLVLVEAALGPARSWQETSVAVVYAVFRWSLVFFAWHALYVGFALAVRRQEAELARAELERAHHAARLRSLEAALNPHFLFNALNSVRALVNIDAARADEAITRLARLLRSSLGAERAGLVSVREELAVVDDYLAIEHLRLDTRLHVDRSVDDAALARRLPSMILQTLVENAIVHGIAQLPEGGTLRLAIRIDDGALRIDVENPRPSLADRRASSAGAGIGLTNARERLALLGGPASTLTLTLTEHRAHAVVVVA